MICVYPTKEGALHLPALQRAGARSSEAGTRTVVQQFCYNGLGTVGLELIYFLTGEVESKDWFLPDTHTQEDRESFLDTAACTRVDFTHLRRPKVHMLAVSCEILYRCHHRGNVSGLFHEIRGRKYLSKKADCQLLSWHQSSYSHLTKIWLCSP